MTTRPNMEQLEQEALELYSGLVRQDAAASARLRDLRDLQDEVQDRVTTPQVADPLGRGLLLTDAQLILAREHGFSSWSRLKRFIEDLEDVDRAAAALQEAWRMGDQAVRAKAREAKEPYFRHDRFENPDPNAALTDHDARTLVAMDRGYARWEKYESLLHLDPNVREIIAAIKEGDLAEVQHILAEDPRAAEPHWVSAFAHNRSVNRKGFEPGPDSKISNDSVPQFIVSESFFNRSNKKGNEYELTKALLAAGADPMIAGHLPMTAACSYNDMNSVRALLEGGAEIDGPGGHGINLCYALFFGFTELSEYLAAQGATLDLRFAAGLGRLDLVRDYFTADGLKPGAGDLADPYRTESNRPHNAPRTHALILQQALMFACVHGRLEVAEYLIEQGADPSAIVTGLDVNCTAMHRLAELGTYGPSTTRAEVEALRLPAVELLLTHGYDRAVTDVQHHATALQWAEHSGAEQIAALLRES